MLAFAVVGCGSSRDDPTRERAVVARIGDGDTFDVRSGDRIRLIQIDAPELGEGECYAREALKALELLTPQGSGVGLERDTGLDDTDRYGRLLRYVHTAELNVNVELVRRGAAAPYFFRGDEGRYADLLLDAVDAARDGRRGMWGSCRVSWEPDRAVVTRPR